MKNGVEAPSRRDDDRRDEDPPKKANYYKDFSANTSLHGVKYTAEDERSTLEKVFWTVMVLTSFGICWYLVAQVYHKWIPFPALTICPGTSVPSDKFNYTEVCSREGDYNNDEEQYMHSFSSFFCDNACMIDQLDKVASDATLDAYKNISTPLSSFFVYCVIYSEPYLCDQLFKPIMTDVGLCFTANMLSFKDIFREEIKHDDFYLNFSTLDSRWTLDNWYSKETPFHTHPIRARGSGQTSSLMLMLKSERAKLDPKCSGVMKGFKFAVHAPYVLPHMNDNYMVAQFGSFVSINVKPDVMTTSGGLKNYTPDKRQCYFSDERRLKYFKNYTRENCEFECLTNYTMEVCGCVSASMPRDKSMPVCSGGSILCVGLAMAELNVMEESEEIPEGMVSESASSEKKRALEAALSCHCLQSCTSISYHATPRQGRADLKTIVPEEEESLYDTSMIVLYMGSPHFMMSKRSELYGVIDFLANCGGLIGVCLGFSILSLVEIVYFFIIRFLCDVSKRHKKPQVPIEEGVPLETSQL